MHVVSITPGRNSRLVWLKFDNGRLLPLKIDDLVVLSISKNEPLSPESLNRLEKESLKFMLEEYALRQIAISPKIDSILLPKLKNKCLILSKKFGYSPELFTELINDLVQMLDSRGLLDKTEYANYYAKRHSKMSYAQISFNLKRLGVANATNLPPVESDINKITKLINKKYSLSDFSDYRTKNKIYSALMRLGFTISDIKNAIDDYVKIR